MIRSLSAADIAVFWPIVQARYPGMADMNDALPLLTSSIFGIVLGDPAMPALVRLDHHPMQSTQNPLYALFPGQPLTQITDCYGPSGRGLSDPATLLAWRNGVLPVLRAALSQMVAAFPVVATRPAWGHVQADLGAALQAAFPTAKRLPIVNSPDFTIYVDRLSDAA